MATGKLAPSANPGTPAAEPSAPAPAAPGPAPARPGLIAVLSRSSAEYRKATIDELNDRVGNRCVARMISGSRQVARTPGPVAGALPEAATKLLAELGLSPTQMTAFANGEMVMFEIPVPGQQSTVALLQLKPGVVRGGIFSINVPKNPKAALSAFFRFRQPVLNIARAVGAPEIELFGAATHNKDILEMFRENGWAQTKEVIPESFGMGPADTVDVFSKRFPVHGGKPPTGGGGGAPPSAPPGGGAPPAEGAPPGSSAAPPEPAPPPARPAPVEPAPAAGAKPSPVEAGPPPGAGLRLGLLRLGGSVVVTAVLWFLAEKLKAAEARRVNAMFKEKVDPQISTRLKDLNKEAERLTLEEPLLPVYAVVNVDMRYSGFTGTFGSSETILDVTFVSVDGLTREKLYRERTLETSSPPINPSAGGYGVATQGTRRVTYASEVSFDDPHNDLWRRKQAVLAERKAKARAEWEAKETERLYAEAAKDAEAGRSVRRRAEIGKPGPPLTARERAERSDPRIDHAGQAEREKADSIRYARAYIKYTSGRAHLMKLRIDAVRYLDELEGRRPPAKEPGPMDWPDRVRDPAQQKAMEDWLKGS